MELKYFKPTLIDVYMYLKVLHFELDVYHNHSCQLYDSLLNEVAIEELNFLREPDEWVKTSLKYGLCEKWESIIKFKSGDHYFIWLCYQLELKLKKVE